ncbi:MAG: hypothetical protein OQJ97_06455 [Rhodospirillales bacterium]|nr:hypothetical protein [Rhodospirillales bacterium]
MNIDPSNSDILHSASKLAETHGRDASLIAELRANELKLEGNLAGYRMWKRISLVVDELLSNGEPDTTLFH